MAQQSGFGIEEIYRGVIGDVANQVREAFLDEGVDIEVLQQLKKSWEAKIQASGAVDFEGTSRQPIPPPPLRQGGQGQPTPIPALRQNRQQVQAPIPVQPPPMPEQLPGPSSMGQSQSQPRHFLITQQQQQPTHSQLQLLLPQMLSGAGVQLPPGVLPGTVFVGQDGNLMLLNPQQMQLNNQLQAQLLLQQNPDSSAFRRSAPQQVTTKTEPQNHVPQLDGGSSLSIAAATSLKHTNSKSLPKKAPQKKVIPQLDGGGPGMTDSSSEEEQEEDDPFNRFAGMEDDPAHGEEEDEEPLNSGDDQSDDEDLETLFDADNVIVCQFEKVHRARNKWKFILKDGLMQVKGKDYCFHKSTGEAEW